MDKPMEQYRKLVVNNSGFSYVTSFGETPEESCMRVLGLNEYHMELIRICKAINVRNRHKIMMLAYELEEQVLSERQVLINE